MKAWNLLLMILVISIFCFIWGLKLNFLAIVHNDCRMPVYKIDINNSIHSGFWDKSEVKYYYFTDIINVGAGLFSIGDILQIAGLLLLIGYAGFLLLILLKRKWKKWKNKKKNC